MKLLVHIIEARNLLSKDSNGFSDPFVMLQLGNQKFRTKVIDMNLNPIWDEKFSFELRDVRDALRLVVYDKDLIGMDFLGKVKFPISDLLNTENLSYGTQWYKLQPESEKSKIKECGEIHVTITIERGEVRHSFSEPIPVADAPKKSDAEQSSLARDISDIDSAPSKQDSRSSSISEAANDTEERVHSHYSSKTDDAQHRGDNYKREAEELENSLKEEREVLKAAETRIAQLEEELKILRLENKKIRDEVAESSSQHVQKFLGSNSFKKASQYAVQELMQAFIHNMLKDLGDHYPFIPEQLGYGPVPPNLQVVKDLSNFKWDEITDEMQGLDGEEFPKSGNLRNVKPIGLIYTWKSMGYKWPADVTVAPPIENSDSEDKEEETKEHSSSPQEEETENHRSLPQEEEIERHLNPLQEQQISESEDEEEETEMHLSPQEEETEKHWSPPQEEEIEKHLSPLQEQPSSESEYEYEETENHLSPPQEEEIEKDPSPLQEQQSSESEDEFEEIEKNPFPLQEQPGSESEDEETEKHPSPQEEEIEKHSSPFQEQKSSESENEDEETEKHLSPPQDKETEKHPSPL